MGDLIGGRSYAKSCFTDRIQQKSKTCHTSIKTIVNNCYKKCQIFCCVQLWVALHIINPKYLEIELSIEGWKMQLYLASKLNWIPNYCKNAPCHSIAHWILHVRGLWSLQWRPVRHQNSDDDAMLFNFLRFLY